MDGLHGVFLTHDTASLQTISAASNVDTDVLRTRLRSRGAKEAFVLRTCHRVELYVNGEEIDVDDAFETVEIPTDSVRTATGIDVARHAFRVASGLESMIIGEDEILGQFIDARDGASNDLDGTLEVVLDKAIRTGKRVRAETDINEGHTSIATAAIELIRKTVPEIEAAKVIVVGTGDMGRLVSEHLVEIGADVAVANRTYETAESWAREISAEPVPLGNVHTKFGSANLLVTATDSSRPIFEHDDLSQFDLVAVDIATPPDIAPDVEEMSDVDRFDIGDIEGIAAESESHRRKAKNHAEAIVETELDHLKDLLKKRRAEEMLARIYRRAEEIRSEEIERALNSIDADERTIDEEVFEQCTKSIVNRLLSTPTQSIKDAAIDKEYATLEAVADVFEVDHPVGEIVDPIDRNESSDQPPAHIRDR